MKLSLAMAALTLCLGASAFAQEMSYPGKLILNFKKDYVKPSCGWAAYQNGKEISCDKFSSVDHDKPYCTVEYYLEDPYTNTSIPKIKAGSKHIVSFKGGSSEGREVDGKFQVSIVSTEFASGNTPGTFAFFKDTNDSLDIDDVECYYPVTENQINLPRIAEEAMGKDLVDASIIAVTLNPDGSTSSKEVSENNVKRLDSESKSSINVAKPSSLPAT